MFPRLRIAAVRVPDLNNILDHSDPTPPPLVDPNPQVMPSKRKRHELPRAQAPAQMFTLMPVHVEATDGVQTVAGWMVARACRRLEVFHILPPVVRAGEVVRAVSGYTVRITRWAGYDLCDVEEAAAVDAALEVEWSDELIDEICSG